MEEKKLDDAKDEDGNTEKAPDNDAEAKAANEALIQRRLEVVSIVCQALEGWCGVEPSAVTVELAAPPKAYIFKVSTKVASPSVVILKFGGGSDSRTAEAETSVGDRRTEAATAMFMTQGICPARLAASDDASWWIEACAGPMLFDFECTGAYTCDDTFDAKHVAHREKLSSAAAEYGRLLGKIHAAPTNWFSPFIEEGVAAYPFLQSLPEAGSFLWLYQYRDEEFKASMTYHSAEPQRLQRLQALLAALPTPRCPALARLVTSHGDLWYANVLWNPEGGGLLACDLESSCVMRGIYDWMHCQILWYTQPQLAMWKRDPDAPNLVRTMLRAYLEQLGEPAGPGDVDVALFDIRSFTLGSLYIREGLDAMYYGPYRDPEDGEGVKGVNDDAAQYDDAMHNIEAWQQRMQIVWDDPEQRRAFVGAGWLETNSGDTPFWKRREDFEPKY
jgi:hypothetical protein